MTDDFVAGAILPVPDVPDDGDFDPDAIDSDAYLDDELDAVVPDELVAGATGDDEDPELSL